MTIDQYNNAVLKVSGRLYSYIKKSSGDKDLAHDIVQESFARLWENHKELKAEQAEKWLFTTAYRAMLNWIRDNKRSVRISESDYAEPIENPDNYELREWMLKGLEKLNDESKHLILLRDMQGYSYKEIEEITGMKESQVKVYLFRARKKLKEILSQLAMVL